MEFPFYVQMKDGSVSYRIDSNMSFRELKRLGSLVLASDIKAEDYPTRLYIEDLISAVKSGDLMPMDVSDFYALDPG